ncbi:DNA repair protein complementing XP-C cells homolog [Toxorhynchites rutilus septentrionalis]|uniref:DNA repair protein complementing XP-C cells homolog n=1 Tax=Toxorhynchites rutilus septentrionalis TaxID=329112 RepID=UPI00247A6809|nr:DNA repair protein complementing XP-C cells homolog [Toxorhynchites rutilus septentrionalis]
MMISEKEQPISAEDSIVEFSASEDEWYPTSKSDSKGCLDSKSAPKDKFKTARKRKPADVGTKNLQPTRISRRIANRLGKIIPEVECQSVTATENESSTSDSETESRNISKKTSTVKRGRKPKSIKEAPIKLTTFSVEELYRKYRPDLAGKPETKIAKINRVKLKEHNDDDSSGDDYLVDPADLDLNSDFFTLSQTSVAQDSKSFEPIVCDTRLEKHESSDSDEDNIPLKCLKKERIDSSEFSKKLIEQINQTNQHCMNMIKLAEVSHTARSSEVKGEEKVSELLLAGEKISGLPSTQNLPVEKEAKKQDKHIEITIKLDSVGIGTQQEKKIDLLTAVKRFMNREKRQNQIDLHKVSILCWIGHGTFLNRTIADSKLTQLIIKRLLPSATCRPKGLTNVHYFEQITRYFRKVVKLKYSEMYFKAQKLPPLKAILKYQILQRSAFSKRDFVLLFLLMLRSLQIHSRLVISLVVPPKHVPAGELYRMMPQTREELEADRRLLSDFLRAPKHSTIFKVKEKLNAMVRKDSAQVRKRAARKIRYEGFSSTISQNDGCNDFVESRARENVKQLVDRFVEMEQNVTSELAKKSDKVRTTFAANLDEEVRQRREKILLAYRASKERNRVAKAKAQAQDESCSSSTLKSKVRVKRKKLNQANSPGVDIWLEAYCENEDKWITIDVLNNKVHCLEDIVTQASQPISYVLAWNNDGTIKDVSPRYISRLGSKKSKLRVEDSWLERSLMPYRPSRSTRRDRSEDLKFEKLLNKRPFPEQIGEYKNHPRFAIARHLLRNEAIYPRDAIILGYIKDEPIYPRDCVHVLFSREGWLRQAKTVQLHEEPYKIVKAKARYDRLTGTSITGLQTELFGMWQVQDYEPPVAENGVVPRSAYGNVELFKPCMLPKGTVHLQLPGLNKICKRLRVDCAPTITGFEYRNNACQAVYDGYVVCAEFRDQVIDEWYQEQVELERKEDEKVKKRVYGNWKRLVMGLFIRKKLKDRYNFDNI